MTLNLSKSETGTLRAAIFNALAWELEFIECQYVGPFRKCVDPKTVRRSRAFVAKAQKLLKKIEAAK